MKRILRRTRKLSFGLTVLFILAWCTIASADTPEDYELQHKIDRLHQYIWKHFLNPELNIFYDYITPGLEDNRWKHLPTKEEIAAEKPNPAGWKSGMEDGTLNGSAYLAGMIYRYEVTGKQEHAEEARKIFQGLVLLGTVSDEKGFIARAVLPDGKTYYPSSSVDQYTVYVFAMWEYYHSSIATEEERKQIREIVHDICVRIERDNFEVLSAYNKPINFGDIGNISTDRASRLLELLLVGYDITEEKHWQDVYQEKLQEKEFGRLKKILVPSALKKFQTYAVLQNQVSLIPLFELESSLQVRSVYLNALKLNADIVEERLSAYQKYTPEGLKDYYQLGGWRTGQDSLPRNIYREYHLIRVPCETMIIMLLSRNHYLVESFTGIQEKKYVSYLRDECLKLLSVYDYNKMESTACLYAEIAYWLAVKQNILEYKKEEY